ncbi:MAG: family 16 glycosylhydrolase [Lentisphaeria bacterium]|nr:family 16 glycosylhydrolase [Lentisphaeria bacterium]
MKMRSRWETLSLAGLVVSLCLGANRPAEAAETKQAVSGNLVLSASCVVFAPFEREDGVPAAAELLTLPETLDLGGKRIGARSAKFDAKRVLDLAPFIGAKGDAVVGKTAFVYIPFTVEKTGPVTFGFGADWWYEAYLDGASISETLSSASGNGSWPPCIHDFTATTKVTAGNHILVVRFVSGKASSLLAVGGPVDLRNPAIKGQARPKREAQVTRARYREGPPAGRKWKLVWAEEFEGTTIDLDRWQIRRPDNPWNVPGIATKYAEENCAVDGKGHLLIRLTRDEDGTVRFTRGINTRTFEKAYGYFETRVQFSTQPGWWTAVWLSGVPYGEGHDTFLFPQEFDIFEDFYKPKKSNDISHCYHATAGLSRVVDQGDGKGIGGNDMMARARVGRVSKGTKVHMEQYDGWHTVAVEWTPLEHIFYVDGQETLRQTYRDVPITTVPQHVWCSGCLRAPKDEKHKPFYGRLEDATFPDQLVVDYVRIYDEDLGEKTVPSVTIVLGTPAKDVRLGQPVTFRVHAEDRDGAVKSLYLFSSGYIRAEATMDASVLEHEFTVTNLFPGDNTLIAMAKDSDGLIGLSKPLTVKVLTGREYTGTAFGGKPQQIPGRLVAGHYDEGGNGVAFHTRSTKADPRLPWRTDEIPMSLETAIPVGTSMASWVTYRIEVAETGDYDVELFMNRPDYEKRTGGAVQTDQSETIRLKLDGTEAATWKLASTWYSGNSWRQPIKPIGQRRVHLTAGLHQLIVDFGGIKTAHTNFGGFEFRKAAR